MVAARKTFDLKYTKYFMPICSQLMLYISYPGEFVKNKTHRVPSFCANDVIKGSDLFCHDRQRGIDFWSTNHEHCCN